MGFQNSLLIFTFDIFIFLIYDPHLFDSYNQWYAVQEGF